MNLYTRRDFASNVQDLTRLARAGRSIAQIVALGYSLLQATRAVKMSKEGAYTGRVPWGSSRKGFTGAKRKALTQGQRGTMRTGGYYGKFNNDNFQQELKFWDISLVKTTASATGTIVPSLTLIAQGTTEQERIGRKVMIKKFMFRYSLQMPHVTGNNDTADMMRIIIYQDRQTNGAAAIPLDILQSADLYSFRNLENSSRFVILKDVTHVMNQVSGYTGTVVRNNLRFQWKTMFIDLNMPVEYSGVTGAITEIRSNNIGMLTLSNKVEMEIEGSFRLRFKG